jgi:inner membrane protease subunit SOM1
MAPPIPTFHVSALPSEINTLPNGKARKPPIDLENCALKEMVQYRCNVDKPKKGQQGVVICEPVVRFYRQ